MKIQNQIKRTLSRPENLAHVANLLDDDSHAIAHRTALAKKVCEHFDFYDVRGKMQLGGCLKALRGLEQQGHFVLPEARRATTSNAPRRRQETVPAATGVPKEVTAIKGLELVLVRDSDEMLIWNELMISEHYLGTAKLVGRQLRYLIRSGHGWLGGFGFAAPALHLEARDRWIGWDKEQRQSHLHTIVGMSRFLIRPGVSCANLASKVLGMSLARLADDFEQHYGYRPLLVESFVDTERYSGTCYRATNWQAVGKTKGRGRQDRQNQSALSRKTIFLYPLVPDFRQRLGLSENAGLGALTMADGLDDAQWAAHEFGGAPLGDARLSRRLVDIAQVKAEAPGSAFAGAVNGDWAKTKAYYRLIDQPDESAVTLENILAPHRQRTQRRMMGQETVLCLQDGSELNYTNLDKCSGLGDLKANQTGAKTRGLNLHSTLAVSTTGLPLGVLKAQCIAPKARPVTDKRKPSQIPIEEKKTFVWVDHYRDLVECAKTMPQTRIVSVCDREADFFELFDEQRNNPGVDLLIRAQHNRNLDGDGDPIKLFSVVRQSPVQSQVRIRIPSQSARSKKSKQKVKAARPARSAVLSLRHQTVQLPAPEYCRDKKALSLQLVHAVEENPPPDSKAVEWFLLTTLKIHSAEDIEKCLRWYALRWRIEDWHRVLKSGCGIDNLAHETAQRLRRAIGINLVIAWRIMLMTLLGRETPDLPAEVLFSDVELQTLRAYAQKKN